MMKEQTYLELKLLVLSHHETIELDERLLLDFDENNTPTALEIHNASKD